MYTILVIDKTGSIKQSRVTSIEDNEMYKKAGLKSPGSFSLQTIWKMQLSKKYEIKVFAKTDGRAGYENKYELPPPIDKELYFGNIVLVNQEGDLTIEEWNIIYDKLHGGFEDLEESDEEQDEDDEDSQQEYVKEGYKKDGFIVDDETEESLDEESDEDEFYLTDELTEEEYV